MSKVCRCIVLAALSLAFTAAASAESCDQVCRWVMCPDAGNVTCTIPGTDWTTDCSQYPGCIPAIGLLFEGEPASALTPRPAWLPVPSAVSPTAARCSAAELFTTWRS
jgi:hypothetical protein